MDNTDPKRPEPVSVGTASSTESGESLDSQDHQLSITDPGDETARRFRYQWTFAAIACCMILDETADVVEVYCEHHEDVLLKHSDGTFTGIQVKTRQADQEVWRTSDEALFRSFVRFVRLDQQYPNRFRGFVFATQHTVFAGDNGKDMNFILSSIDKLQPENSLPAPVQRFVTKVAKAAACQEDHVLRTFRKSAVEADLPKLKDVGLRLISDLESTWEGASGASLSLMRNTAERLVGECFLASSLSSDDCLPAYIGLLPPASEKGIKERIEGKKFDKARLMNILSSANRNSALLLSSVERLVVPGTGDDNLLEKKLDAGGISVVSMNLAMDLRDRADFLGRTWTQKYGHEKGLQRYGHIQTLVHSDAARAFDETHTPSEPFGPKMLASLRKRLSQRRDEGAETFDCTAEHLEGFAYSLTAMCKVQWSHDRPWEHTND